MSHNTRRSQLRKLLNKLQTNQWTLVNKENPKQLKVKMKVKKKRMRLEITNLFLRTRL